MSKRILVMKAMGVLEQVCPGEREGDAWLRLQQPVQHNGL